MMSYLDKYIIYKNKYLALKNNMTGGADESIKEFLGTTENIPYTMTKESYTMKDNMLHLVKIKLNDDDSMPVLFVLAGMSHKSFVGTSSIIISKLTELKTKFSSIYLLEYDSFKEMQNFACGRRDELKAKSKKDIYKPELKMNTLIAKNIDSIIKKLKLKNIHLLGKCNGGWIILLMLLRSKQYTGLYLAVPGIPHGVDILQKINKKRLKEINFVFGWTKQDGFLFHWGQKSFQEKERYDKMMKDMKITYISEMYDNNMTEDPKIYHEVSLQLIDTIIKSL